MTPRSRRIAVLFTKSYTRILDPSARRAGLRPFDDRQRLPARRLLARVRTRAPTATGDEVSSMLMVIFGGGASYGSLAPESRLSFVSNAARVRTAQNRSHKGEGVTDR